MYLRERKRVGFTTLRIQLYTFDIVQELFLTFFKVNFNSDETDKERNFSLRFMTGMEARKTRQVARLVRLFFVSLCMK